MKTVELENSDICAFVDDDDFHLLAGRKWYLLRIKNSDLRYATSYYTDKDGVQRTVLMHRIIMMASSDVVVDHKNRNGLDNQKLNLRVCSRSENLRNRKMNRNNKSGFKGVHYDATRRKHFRAEISVDGVKIRLGSFLSAQEAHDAYKIASHNLHKEFSRIA